MTFRLASAAAAVVLSLGALASPALAGNAASPAESSAYAASVGAGRVVVDDELTTGSVVTRHGGDSAQEGNAEQNSFPVWQYGRTSGGTR